MAEKFIFKLYNIKKMAIFKIVDAVINLMPRTTRPGVETLFQSRAAPPK